MEDDTGMQVAITGYYHGICFFLRTNKDVPAAGQGYTAHKGPAGLIYRPAFPAGISDRLGKLISTQMEDTMKNLPYVRRKLSYVHGGVSSWVQQLIQSFPQS